LCSSSARLPGLLAADEERRVGVERKAVASSSLKAVGYDAQQRLLEIEFQHGGVYQYSGVPANVYQALLAAPSLGRYFNESIRGDYDSREITPGRKH
jgi:hypothetical protein